MTDESKSTGKAKRLVAIVLAAFALGSVSYAFLKKENASSTTTPPVVSLATIATDTKQEPGKSFILVRYLHGTARCVSCKKIEAYADEAIRSGFPKEIESGRLVWSSIDVETPATQHLIQEFQLSSKSIVLTDEGTKTPRAFKKLDKIWELLNDKAAFIQYVQNEIRAYLGGA